MFLLKELHEISFTNIEEGRVEKFTFHRMFRVPSPFQNTSRHTSRKGTFSLCPTGKNCLPKVFFGESFDERVNTDFYFFD